MGHDLQQQDEPHVYQLFVDAPDDSAAKAALVEVLGRYGCDPGERFHVTADHDVSETGAADGYSLMLPAEAVKEVRAIDGVKVIAIDGLCLLGLDIVAGSDAEAQVNALLDRDGFTLGERRPRWVGFGMSETGWLSLHGVNVFAETVEEICCIVGLTVYEIGYLYEIEFDVPDGSAAMGEVVAVLGRYGADLGQRRTMPEDYEGPEEWVDHFRLNRLPEEAIEALEAMDGIGGFEIFWSSL